MTEFVKKGFVQCRYGKIKVILYNISNDQMIKTRGFNTFNPKVMLVHIIRSLKSNIETFCALSIIYIQVAYGGVINIAIIGIIIFAVFVEEYQGQSFWWKFLYIMFLIINMSRKFLLISDEAINRKDTVEFFLGSNTSAIMVIAPVMMIMFLIENLKKGGFSKKALSDFENTGSCVARLVLNKDIEPALERICENQERQSEQNTNYFISITEDIMDKASHASLKLEATKNLIDDYAEINRFKMKAMYGYKKVIRLMQNEIFRISKEDVHNFWFRNFSSKVSLTPPQSIDFNYFR